MQEAGLKEKPYKIVKATGTVFPSHIHNVYEVLRVTRGSSHAVIDEKEYHLSEGECLAVFPLQYHSYSVDKSSRIEIYVFSPHFIAEFEEFAVGKTPREPRFDGNLLPKSPTEIGNILAVKSFFYTLCHELSVRISFEEHTAEGANPSLLDRLFLFVDKHYDGECTLAAASEALAYDYTYLSKLFKSKTGMPYGEYVSRFRVGRATYELVGSDKNISEIAYMVGFDSIRTFNFEFKRILGTTPREYRKEIIK